MNIRDCLLHELSPLENLRLVLQQGLKQGARVEKGRVEQRWLARRRQRWIGRREYGNGKQRLVDEAPEEMEKL